MIQCFEEWYSKVFRQPESNLPVQPPPPPPVPHLHQKNRDIPNEGKVKNFGRRMCVSLNQYFCCGKYFTCFRFYLKLHNRQNKQTIVVSRMLKCLCVSVRKFDINFIDFQTGHMILRIMDKLQMKQRKS